MGKPRLVPSPPSDAPIITDQDFEAALPDLPATNETDMPVPGLPPELESADPLITENATDTLPEIPPATDEALIAPCPLWPISIRRRRPPPSP